MKYFSHLNSAVQIINDYDGKHPFHQYLKNFFRAQRKYGSKDRKSISNLCYSYFRIGHLFQQLTLPERITAALFVCTDQPNEFLQQLKPDWESLVVKNIREKIEFINGSEFKAEEIFPWLEHLSPPIQKEEFAISHLLQPDLFIRLRPGKEKTVKSKLKDSGIEYNEISAGTLALKNSVAIDKLINLDEEAVVQDYSSQLTGNYLEEIRNKISNPSPVIWDACSGSGGKSILCYDIFKKLSLDVSDIRPTILHNLQSRFHTAGISNYHSFEADLSIPNSTSNTKKYDLVIADVPCSGSGTWGRTPEQLIYFDEKQIEWYANLQKNILKNLVRNIQPNSFLLYITCSTFKIENEEQVEFANQTLGLNVVRSEIIPGYNKKADTMFAAILTTSPV
ncbi:MAG: Fmu (Sun) domain-containing protein [Bacteroidetes bacterium]|nr:MAG: Fmu (Sun) domain-containing protein [Bacteroidota bacterium]